MTRGVLLTSDVRSGYGRAPLITRTTSMPYHEEVNRQIEKAREWFDIECRTSGITPKIKVSLAREIQKCLGDNPVPRVKIALLSLVLADQIPNPLQLTEADIENALWLVRDMRIGFDENAPVAVKFFQ